MLPPNDLVFRVTEEQRILCVALNTPEIIEAAKNIAYYSALLDALHYDPLANFEHNQQLAEFYQTEIIEYVEKYQKLVNEEL